VTREHGGHRVLGADRKLSIVVFDDGSTSELLAPGVVPPEASALT
jgi:hypothetical protein